MRYMNFAWLTNLSISASIGFPVLNCITATSKGTRKVARNKIIGGNDTHFYISELNLISENRKRRILIIYKCISQYYDIYFFFKANAIFPQF